VIVIGLTGSIDIPVYAKANEDSPVRRYRLKIKPVDGGYLIDHKLFKTRTTRRKTPPEIDIKGKFTAMVNRKKKKRVN